MTSIRDTLIASLQQRGWTFVDHQTRKYVVMVNPLNVDRRYWVFLGRSGAARLNTKPTVDGSIPMSDRSRAILLRGRQDNDNAKSI